MQNFISAGQWAVFATLAIITPTVASARDFTAGTIVIQQPWARATPGGVKTGGGYLTIANKGGTPDRLVGGSFAASAGFQLHSMTMEGGVMKMRPMDRLDIPPGGSVTLKPSGDHIMFTGLTRGLKKGETITGTLVFEHAGTVPVAFEVEGIGARAPGPSGHDMPGMNMD